MKKILNSEQMKIYENNTIENIGVDGVVLMERAALCLTNYIINKFPDRKTSVLILAGTGNNGADGLCLCRQLIEKGYKPQVYINYGHSHSSLFDKQKNILDQINAVFTDDLNKSYELYVDALLGIGIKGLIDEKTQEIISVINAKEGFKLSVDLPSGLNSDTGLAANQAIKADVTFSFGFYKAGLFYNQAVNYTGKVLLDEIGIFDYDSEYEATLLEKSEIELLKNIRINNSNKSTYGKVLIIAGNDKMCGCGLLAAKAAFKTGSGMVKLVTHALNALAVNTSLPEVMLTLYEDSIDSVADIIKEDIEWCDCILCGPGIGTDDNSFKLVDIALKAQKNILLDADALNCISINENLKKAFIERCAKKEYVTVITPHKGEAKRLLLSFDIKALDEMADRLNIVIVDKDARSRILGRKRFVNPTGNNGMSTAGSGDVLAGIIAAMMGFKSKHLIDLSDEEVVAYAVYLHGAAADYALNDMHECGITASDIVDNIAKYIGRL